uniref:5'-tyrosyl-DNA phosphodiesterase n=1 Tax=Acrobeloides nanus TaxID=290746 RepID=A0A914C9H6_9BILA
MAQNSDLTDADCEEAIRKFAEITNTDEALAHFYLQDFNYDLDTAMAAFYSEQAEVAGTSNQANDSGSENEIKSSESSDNEESTSEIPAKKAKIVKGSVEKIPKELTMITWNIDGNDRDALNTRFLAMLHIIAKKVFIYLCSIAFIFDTFNPEIIFFQEFVKDLLPKLREVMAKMYTIIVGNEAFPYFVVTLVSKDIKIERYMNIPFTTTGMGRTMLVVEGKSGGLNIKLINTHLEINPEIIFFQEFVKDLLPKLREVMAKMYTIIVGNEAFPYFVVTLVSKDIKIERYMNIPFTTTGMGRTMLVVEGKSGGLNIKLINTHLESMADKKFSDIRKGQLIECFEKMKPFINEPNTLSIFGGDLNIRDHEISDIPPKVLDAWCIGGCNRTHKYTWDQTKNDNHTAFKKGQHRFDRVYFSGPYKNVDFCLHGTQRIKPSLVFPSDHFAVCCRFFNAN